jgi:hypothetical protein
LSLQIRRTLIEQLDFSNMESKDAVSVTHADLVDDNLKVNHADPVGTVRLIDHNEVVLIPTPSPDPRGEQAPENLVYFLTGPRPFEPSAMAKMGHNFHSQSL